MRVLLLLCAILTFGALLGRAAFRCDCNSGTGTCVPDHGDIVCRCIGNWTGSDCSQFICDRDNPCQNGGSCVEDRMDRSLYLCVCPTGFTGPHCQYRTNQSVCMTYTCNNGTCFENTTNGQPMCLCEPGYWGVSCENANTEETPDPCQDPEVQQCHGNGVCVYNDDPPRFYNCDCDQGWDDFNFCEFQTPIDYCSSDLEPCEHGGTCIPQPENSTYHCECLGDFTGVNCTVPFDVCASNPCQNGGTCQPIEGGHYFSCFCPPEFSGESCEGYVDPCLSLTCQNGSCVRDAVAVGDGVFSSNVAHCECACGYEGLQCENEIVVDYCRGAFCRNGATCTSNSGSYTCHCPPGFSGRNCETGFTDYCADSPCGALPCVNLPETFVCVCGSGWGGQYCSVDLDECGDSPCVRGECENIPGSYVCVCLPGFTGEHCEIGLVNCSGQPCMNGGTCERVQGGGGREETCTCPPEFTGLFCEVQLCPMEQFCAEVANDSTCNPECFSEACGYDGAAGVCFTPNGNGSDPWVNCSNRDCRTKFDNGVCDVQCNVPECLYDGRDCVPLQECPDELRRECERKVGNGRCENECNSALCSFDAADCNSRHFVEGFLVLIIIADRSMPFQDPYRDEFLMDVGRLTNSIAVVVETTLLSPSDLEALEVELGYVIIIDTDTFNNAIIYQVTLQLDIEHCRAQCPATAKEAAEILQAYYSTGRTNLGPYAVADVYAEDEPPEEDKGSSFPFYFIIIAVVVVILAGAIGAGILYGKRKRQTIRAKLWRPQSPASESSDQSSPSTERRKSNQPGAVVGTEAPSISRSDSDEYIAKGSKAAKMDNGSSAVRWSDLRVPVADSSSSSTSPSTAVIGQVGHDSRKWSAMHYEAVQNPKLAQQRHRHQNGKTQNVNTSGPGGFTPLMLAVTQRHSGSSFNYSRSSSESSGDVAENSALITSSGSSKLKKLTNGTSTASSSDQNEVDGASRAGSSRPTNTVTSLLAAKADVNVVNDFGQTALHLAASCGRGDYVKQLLEANADPNRQDNWGQSSLHVVIGASAEGAFTIILNHKKMDIALKCDGGLTSLMLAVKGMNTYMVRQLVKKNADIAAVDSEGRTAVHWAALVDNLEALKLLIRQGPDTIKDQQDSKGQTPLFLACREGCANCVRHLIDCFANATLLDTLDRSPIHIAFEKQHHDIVEMLKQSSHGPLIHYHPHSRGMYSGPAVEHEAFMRQASRPLTRPIPSARKMKPHMQSAKLGTLHNPMDSVPDPMHYSRQQQAAEYLAAQTSHPMDQTYVHSVSSGLSGIPLDTLQTSEAASMYMDPTPHSTTSSSLRQLVAGPLCTSYVGIGPPHAITSSAVSLPSSQPPTSGYGDSTVVTMSYEQPLHREAIAVTDPSTSMSYYPQLSTPLYSDPSAMQLAPKVPIETPVSLSDIEPTMTDLITSMADDLGSISHSSAPYISSSIAPVSQSNSYVPQTLDDLPSVGYGMPARTSIPVSTVDYAPPPSSSYQQTAYNCQDCSQTVAPTTTNPSYPTTSPPGCGSTRRLSHLPVEVDPPSQYTHRNGYSPPQTTSGGRSPLSYYPSPPNSNDLHHSVTGYTHASPPSLTPSPETREDMLKAHMDITTESSVEGFIPPQDFAAHMFQHPHYQTHFITQNMAHCGHGSSV